MPDSEPSELFYQQLEPLKSFQHSIDPANLSPLPGDWNFFVADVVDSTSFIALHGARKINQVAAACITAVLNSIGRESVPYVFGGDGAQMAVPARHQKSAMAALQAVARRARRLYGMKLRVAGFRSDILARHGHEIRVGKLCLSPDVDQAVFWGNGLDSIEQWIREGDWALEEPDELPEADLTGLECRWKEIPGKQDEIINLLVQVMPQRSDAAAIYSRVLGWIEEAFGPEGDRYPLRLEDLDLMLRPDDLKTEVDFRNFKCPGWLRKCQCFWKALENRVGITLMRNKARLLGVNWDTYHQGVRQFGDHQKFSGMLALTSSTSTPLREKLESQLDEAFQNGELAYGLHVSDRVLITCMVLDRSTHHRHFVDGTGGGYTQAARFLKKRLSDSEA